MHSDSRRSRIGRSGQPRPGLASGSPHHRESEGLKLTLRRFWRTTRGPSRHLAASFQGQRGEGLILVGLVTAGRLPLLRSGVLRSGTRTFNCCERGGATVAVQRTRKSESLSCTDHIRLEEVHLQHSGVPDRAALARSPTKSRGERQDLRFHSLTVSVSARFLTL